MLTRLPRLQDPGELQLTSASERARGAGRIESALEGELGLMPWMQVGGGRSVSVLDAEPHQAGISLMFGTWSPFERSSVAFGLEREWSLRSADPASNELFALASMAGSRWDASFDAALQEAGDEYTPHVAMALTHSARGVRGILEADAWFGRAPSVGVAPGLAWHPFPAFEITTEVPLRFESGEVTPSAALQFTYEYGLAR